MPQMVLVVEDEPRIAAIAADYLRHAGYAVVTATDGMEALRLARTKQPDLVVLDLGLPRLGGLDVARTLRAETAVPIVMLTARVEESDRLLGLEIGADDYITKPFSPRELVARVKAVLRRADGGPPPEVVQAGDVAIDTGRREVRVDDEPIELTTKEFELLRFLAERPGLALSRQQILDGVWGYDWFGDARTVDVHIAQVRKKLGDAVEITTVRGVGYRLESAKPSVAT